MGGGKGGGGSSTTTIQKADPWEGQQPYLIGQSGGWQLRPGATGTPVTDSQGNVVKNPDGSVKVEYSPDDYYQAPGIAGVFPEANTLYQSGQLAPEYYAGQTVADQSEWTKEALEMQADRAKNGSEVINSATNAVNAIMNGAGLSGNQGLQTLNQMSQQTNPYLDDLYNRANEQVQSSLNASFSKAGRYGSGAHEAASADAATNLAAEMYGNAYEQQMQAAQAAGQLHNQGTGQQLMGASQAQQLGNQTYTDAAALSEAGGALDDYNQQLINADIERYNYEAQRPLAALNNYNQLIQGNYGGTSTTTGQQSGSSNRLGNVVGGALAGGGIASMLGASNPLIGSAAALGGLLGLF